MHSIANMLKDGQGDDCRKDFHEEAIKLGAYCGAKVPLSQGQTHY